MHADGGGAAVGDDVGVRVAGTVDGEITWPPRGGKGFGYDPIFTATGEQITFAEMDPARKHALSHRADAFRKLVDACFGDPQK